METVPENLFLLQNEEQTGPFPRETIRQMLRLGSVSPEDFAWAEGMEEWVPLESLFGRPAEEPATPAKRKKRSKKKAAPKPESFMKFIGDAMAYPFRGYGWAILLTGTIVLSGIQWFQSLPLSIGLLNLFLNLSAWGYLLMMLQTVIQRTAQGENELPDWPDFEGFGELLGKFFQWMIVLLICFGPALLLLNKLTPDEFGDPEPMSLVLVLVVFIAGAVYCPMALLAVAMFDTIGAVNPMLVVRAIGQVFAKYLGVLLIFGLLMGLKAVTTELSGVIPIAGTLIDNFDSLWSSFFLARVLGGLYAINSHKLNWF